MFVDGFILPEKFVSTHSKTNQSSKEIDTLATKFYTESIFKAPIL